MQKITEVKKDKKYLAETAYGIQEILILDVSQTCLKIKQSLKHADEIFWIQKENFIFDKSEYSSSIICARNLLFIMEELY